LTGEAGRPRTPALDLAKLTPAQQRVHDAIASGPRGKVQGPLKIWLQSAELADKAQALGAFCRYGTSLPPRLSELAILVMGAHWQAGFEWAAHAPIALAAGVDAAAIEAIRRGKPPQFADAAARCVHAFAFELLNRRRVSDATYAEAVDVLGQTAVVELVGLLGYYTLISMTIVTFDVPLPDAAVDPFADVPRLG
jgi:4-carboxymuconolactone decarboxylase